MPLILYPIILIGAVIIFYILGGRQRNSDNKTIQESAKSDYTYSVLIKRNGRMYRSIEGNDINKLAYHIYIDFIKGLDRVDIYIRDNKNNELMHIDKTCESESMVGVDHPKYGHIGFLPFVRVKKI